MVLARRLALPVSALALAVLLAGCGTSEEAAAFNDADVSFLRSMTPHHEQAVEMAELVADRTRRPELRGFAEQVIATQSAEVEQMNGLLEAAGEDPVGGMDHGMDGADQMPGMMDEAQMAELEGLRDQAFDLAFLEMMAEHHQGAIEMAGTVLADGVNPQVAELATGIAEAQRAEVEQMAGWRAAWS